MASVILYQIGMVLIFTGAAMLAVQVECDKLTKQNSETKTSVQYNIPK